MKRVTLILASILVLAGSVPARDLEIFFIDVEGGQATLIVTPAGQSLLIDAGYGPRAGRAAALRPSSAAIPIGSSRRPAPRASSASITCLITHFHNDHVGGVPELASKIPIETFIDYGSPLGIDRMATNGFRAYEPIRDQHEHFEPRPGERLPLKGVEVDFVSSSGALLSAPLSGAGQTDRRLRHARESSRGRDRKFPIDWRAASDRRLPVRRSRGLERQHAGTSWCAR